MHAGHLPRNWSELHPHMQRNTTPTNGRMPRHRHMDPMAHQRSKLTGTHGKLTYINPRAHKSVSDRSTGLGEPLVVRPNHQFARTATVSSAPLLPRVGSWWCLKGGGGRFRGISFSEPTLDGLYKEGCGFTSIHTKLAKHNSKGEALLVVVVFIGRE